MATTATLNGGPTGGLHTTTNNSSNSNNSTKPLNPTSSLLDTNDNPPITPQNLPSQEEDEEDETFDKETFDSNSSFESSHGHGHTELHSKNAKRSRGGHPNNPSNPTQCQPTNNNNNPNYFIDLSSEGSSKKRRKQSRPVRIPLDPLDDNNEDPTNGRNKSQENENDACQKQEEEEEGTLLSRSQTQTQHHRNTVPLNLSSVCQGQTQGQGQHMISGPASFSSSSSNDDNDNDNDETDQTNELSSFQLVNNRHHGSSSFISENDKTDPNFHLGGGGGGGLGNLVGTKDYSHLHHHHSHHHHNRNRPSTTESPNNNNNLSCSSSLPPPPPSFSPGLFPTGTGTGLGLSGSPFSSLFSANLNLFAQQQLQQQQQQQSGGTPNSGSRSGSSAGSANSVGLLIGSGNNVSSSSGGGGGGLPNLPPHRIFNPEAYCDLCNKEFCNKYFLKTHKANKHGVYSDLSPSLGSSNNNNNGNINLPSSSSSSASAFLSASAIFSSASAANLSLNNSFINAAASGSCVNHVTSLAGQGVSGQISSNPGSSVSHTSLLPRTTSPGAAISSEIIPSFSSSSLEKGMTTLTGNNGSSTSATSILRERERDSFCELCQKEFCNKYFLKRHKAKIHGILGPTTGEHGGGHSSSGRSSSNSSNHGNGGGKSRPFSNGENNLKNPTQQQQQQQLMGLSLRDLGLESLGLEIVTKHLEETNARQGQGQHEGQGQGQLQDREEGELLSGDDEATREQQRVRNKHPEDNDLSDDNGDNDNDNNLSNFNRHSTESINHPGENNCQFCLRDFSSKQHLINHLIKKHRLMTLPSSFPPFLFPFPALFEQNNAAPNNADPLLLGEASALVPASSSALANNVDVGEFECNLCHRSFHTVYLLHMHKSYFHPDTSSRHEDDENDDDEEIELSRNRHENDDDEDQDQHRVRHGHDQNDDIHDQELQKSKHNSPSNNDNDDDNDEQSNKKRSRRKDGKNVNNNNNNTEEDVEDEEDERGGGDANTSDSDDLRRLQTMIMALNRVSSAAVGVWSPPPPPGLGENHLNLPQVSGGGPAISPLPSPSTLTYCGICNKEFYSSYFLTQHNQHFHTAHTTTNGGGGGGGTDEPIKSEGSILNTLDPLIRIKTEGGSTSSSTGLIFPSLSDLSKKGSGSSDHPLTISPETLKERLLNQGQGQDFDSSSSSPFLTPGCPKSGLSGLNSNNSSSSLSNIKQDAANNAANNNSNNKRPSPSLSRSYCTICHKELCNKYFMRTHMLKMHGISIESSTGLGGVTCDICNKELCSKYFLKVHKQNTHGIVEDIGVGPSPSGPSTPLLSTGLNLSLNHHHHSSTRSSPSSSSLSDIIGMSGSSGGIDANNCLGPLPKEGGDNTNGGGSSSIGLSGSSSRYFCHYSEVCPFCGRRFRSPKWLKTHLQQDHGDEGRERWKSIERNLRRAAAQQGQGQGQGQNQKNGSNSSSSLTRPSSGGGGGGGGSSKSGSLIPGSSKHSSRVDGNKCAFCSYSSPDVDTMKSHLLKDHSSQLVNRQAMSMSMGMSMGMSDSSVGLTSNSTVTPNHSQSSSSSGMLLDPLSMLFQKMDGGNTKIYRCAYCPFTTSILVYLYAHERTHSQGQGQGQIGQGTQQSPSPSPTYQCPMCFHGFDSAEIFQQHLIQHQMSGVLAPFFTPTSSMSGSEAHAASAATATSHLLSLPLINGASAGDNLYWALKNHSQQNDKVFKNMEQSQETHVPSADASDLTTHSRKKRARTEEKSSASGKKLKSKTNPRFRCCYCQSQFPSRDSALAHVQSVHGGQKSGRRAKREGKELTSSSKRFKKSFKCRKCKFISTTGQMLGLHNKLQHSSTRLGSMDKIVRDGPSTMSRGTGSSFPLPPEGHGIAQEDGQFLMQSFLLSHGEGEEEEKISHHFVPSMIHLPVREKVSQSIRVSFSLTPTSTTSEKKDLQDNDEKIPLLQEKDENQDEPLLN